MPPHTCKPGDNYDDFCLPAIDWTVLLSNSESDDKMPDIAFKYDLTQVVNEYTRIQRDQPTSLIRFFLVVA